MDEIIMTVLAIVVVLAVCVRTAFYVVEVISAAKVSKKTLKLCKKLFDKYEPLFDKMSDMFGDD